MDLFNVPLFLYHTGNKYVSGLAEAKSADEQIKVIKEYSAYILSVEKILVSNLRILSELFLEAPLKHAIKSTITKLFNQIVIGKEIVVLDLSHTIRRRIQSYDKRKKRTLTCRNVMVNSIGSCLENTNFGIAAIRCCVEDVICFLTTSLIQYIDHLSQDISPSDKCEISLFIHVTVRVIISCFNQFPTTIRNTHECQNNIEKLMFICWDLLENPEIPMDTKTNCGTLIAMNANQEKRYMGLIERILREENSTKKLCLLNGIVCTIETELFSEPNFRGFQIFSQTAYILKEISEANSIEPVIILGVSRGFLQMIKKLLSLQITDYLKQDHCELNGVLSVTLGYSLSHLDHYMDSVRHICKELLRVTIQMGVKVNNKLNYIIYDFIRNMRSNINTKCILIGAICSIVKTEAVLQAVPNVIDFLLESLTLNDHENINLHINSCYETLMMSDTYENNKEEWFYKWINPILIEISKNENNAQIGQTLFDLIRKAIKSYPEIAICLIESKTTINFSLVLTSLGIAKKTGLFDKLHSNEMKWKNLLSYTEIKLAMISADASTRMSALHLLTECHKSTEIFTKEDFECILFFLETNISVQTPSLRQKIASYMKNALNRLKSGFLSIIKKSDVDGRNHYYYDFVKKLHNFCLQNLFVGANYSRRTISFQVLMQLLQIASYIFHDEDNTNMWNAEHVKILLKCLDDTYENNKAYCINVLSYCPKDHFANCNHIINYDVAKTLMKSIKPNDALSAAYYLDYLCFVNKDIEPPSATDVPPSSIQPRVYKILQWCTLILQQGLVLAKTSLIRAVKENPMFGSLVCIRHLLSKLDFEEISKCKYWSKFIVKLVLTCHELSQIVSTVVSSSSPEGYLPNGYSIIKEYCFDEDIEMQSLPCNSESDDFSQATSQMVIQCAWRTIKEVFLILGDVVSKSSIPKSKHCIASETVNNSDFLSCDQIVEIGSLFTQLLSETKHRGAFEQAYVGFSKVCMHLWSSQLSELHQLPMKWLQEMIKVINSDEMHKNGEPSQISSKISFTRRSAGIPYMIQALITSELQVSSSKGLQFTMRKLIELCNTGSTTYTRTHSLNILRTLFRSTELGEFIGEFVPDGIKCAINGYGSECWSERNSSTLLFSSLIIRVFGVQRTKDSENLNIRNKMTGSIFFLRYPQLYDFFITELEKASQDVMKGAKSKKLHPLLLLLSRLYPSALEGNESNLKLSRFVPIVSICSGCAVFQTRYLAARVIAIIVSPELVFDRIFLLIESLNRSSNKGINPNSLHGALLQILYLIRTRALGAISDSRDQLNNWTELYTAISNYLFEVKPNFILYGTIIDILIEILARCQNVMFDEDDQFLDDLSNIVDYLFSLTKQRSFYGSDLVIRKLVLIKVIMYMHSDDDNIISACFLCDVDPDAYKYDYLEAVMNIVLLMLDFHEFSSNAEQYNLDQMEIFYLQYFGTYKQTKLQALQNEFLKSQKFHKFLKKIIENNYHYNCTVKAFTIMSYSILGVEALILSGSCRDTVKFIFEYAEYKPNLLKASIYKCIKCLYSAEINKTNTLDIDIGILPKMASSAHCKSIRSTTLQILKNMSKLFNKSKSLELRINYSKAILTLLRDNDPVIREAAAIIVTEILNNAEGLNMKGVYSSYAQRIFLRTLSRSMLASDFTVHQVIAAFLVLMMCDQNENDDRKSMESSQVFDKSETNMYSELLPFKKFCVVEIRTLVVEHTVHIKAHAKKIIEIAEKLSNDKCSYKEILDNVAQSIELVDSIGEDLVFYYK